MPTDFNKVNKCGWTSAQTTLHLSSPAISSTVMWDTNASSKKASKKTRRAQKGMLKIVGIDYFDILKPANVARSVKVTFEWALVQYINILSDTLTNSSTSARVSF